MKLFITSINNICINHRIQAGSELLNTSTCNAQAYKVLQQELPNNPPDLV